MYSCEAKNSFGESKIDFKLEMSTNVNINESQIDGSVSDRIKIPSGTSISIDCPIGRGESPIFWMKKLENASEIISNEKTLVKTFELNRSNKMK